MTKLSDELYGASLLLSSFFFQADAEQYAHKHGGTVVYNPHKQVKRWEVWGEA